jgi:hypothetical protein
MGRVKRQMKEAAILGALVVVLAAGLHYPCATLLAQGSAPGWESPQPLNERCCARFPVPLADPWGQMHVFWGERDGFISYARLDDQGWSAPLEIIASPRGNSPFWPSAAVDKEGYLHVAWVDGAGGPLFYSRAWAFGADDAGAWSEPILLSQKALASSMGVDSTGLVHLVYAPFQPEQGVVHTTTRDGVAWSEPHVVPAGNDLGINWTGRTVELAVDQQDTLHLAWASGTFPESFPPRAVYYQRSTDGGGTWTLPYDPDPQPPEVVANTESFFKNNLIDVAVGPNGDVHLTWHQYSGVRLHRWSSDGGETWSEKETVFPGLRAAFNGVVDMAFDSAGAMHAVAAEGGVWYRRWMGGSWGPVQLSDPRAPDWHHQRVAMVAGHRVYLFYADINDTGIIWYTSKVVDAPADAPEPTPTPMLQAPESALDLATPETTHTATAVVTTRAMGPPPDSLQRGDGLANLEPVLVGSGLVTLIVIAVAGRELMLSRRG